MTDRPFVPAGLRVVHQALRDAGAQAPGATLTVTMTVPADPRAALVVTNVHVAPRPELIPPPPPTPCARCGVTYRTCTEGLYGEDGRTCCGTCYSTATHGQDPWETFHRGHALDQLPPDPT